MGDCVDSENIWAWIKGFCYMRLKSAQNVFSKCFSICWPRQCNLTIWQNQEQDHSNVRTDTPLIQKDKHFPAKIFSVCCNTIAQQLIISAISEHALVSHEMVDSQ